MRDLTYPIVGVAKSDWKLEQLKWSRFVRLFLWLLVLTPLLAEIATQAGWFTTEMGRQPWVVYQVLKTSDAASLVVKPPQALGSIILFSVVYLLLSVLFFSSFIRIVRKGPTTEAPVS